MQTPPGDAATIPSSVKPGTSEALVGALRSEAQGDARGAARTAGAKKGETFRQIETIIANMERCRWYPRDLGSAHVIVNQPDFTLRVMHDGAQVWATRIVIGKPRMPTRIVISMAGRA